MGEMRHDEHHRELLAAAAAPLGHLHHDAVATLGVTVFLLSLFLTLFLLNIIFAPPWATSTMMLLPLWGVTIFLLDIIFNIIFA